MAADAQSLNFLTKRQLSKAHGLWIREELKNSKIFVQGSDGVRDNSKSPWFAVPIIEYADTPQSPNPAFYALCIDSVLNKQVPEELEKDSAGISDTKYLIRIILDWKFEQNELSCTLRIWDFGSGSGSSGLTEREKTVLFPPTTSDLATISFNRNMFVMEAEENQKVEFRIEKLRERLRCALASDVLTAECEPNSFILAGDPGPSPKTEKELEQLNTPTTRADFETAANNLVQILGLDELYTDEQLKEFSDLAAKNIATTLTDLELPKKSTIDLVKISLFKTVILCDDSGSMTLDDRWTMLGKIIDRLYPIASRLNERGISLRFINSDVDSNPESCSNLGAAAVKSKLQEVKPYGGTTIGGALNSKILKPLLKSMEDGDFDSPVLVSIITDGEANDKLEFKNALLDCKKFLESQQGPQARKFGHSAIILQIHYVGTDDSAKEYIESLQQEMGPYIFCNLTPLDKSIEEAGPSESARNLKILEVTRNAVDHAMKEITAHA